MKTKNLTKIALMTAIICIFSPISVPLPISPVPLTLCTFALCLAAYMLEPKEAMAATGLFLFIGAVGVPVFSGYTGGFAKFAGPTGGYLIGYLYLVGITSYFVQKNPNSRKMQILGAFLGTVVTYTFGTFWLAILTNASFFATLPTGALIFLPLDIVKIILACFLGEKLKTHINHIS